LTTPRIAPIKIALCITELEPGGAERCLVELVKRLDRREFEPVVYCLGPRPLDNPSSLANELEKRGTRVHCLGATSRLDFFQALVTLKRHFIAQRPEFVQSFLFHANVVGTLAARRAGVPHILTGIRVAEHAADWHLRWARWTSRGVERHVCVSEAVKEFSRAGGRLPADKLCVIPNGVDVQRFSVAPPCPLERLGVSPGKRIMTCVGRLDRQKGVAWLLLLMPGVLARATEHDLVFVGEGPLREHLTQLAAKLKIADRVHFVGYRRDVPEILAASDVLLLASEWEGMPNVVLEAMAAGKPVVATDAEGVSELLGPGASDQMVSPRRPEIFAARLLEILENPGFAANLGAANHERVKRTFSLDAMANAYAELYRRLASG
jgi:glycosyltransferase involved in cell wall biosynthesis